MNASPPCDARGCSLDCGVAVLLALAGRLDVSSVSCRLFEGLFVAGMRSTLVARRAEAGRRPRGGDSRNGSVGRVVVDGVGASEPD